LFDFRLFHVLPAFCPVYAMFTKFCWQQYQAGDRLAVNNCHHGAPHDGIGGWQVVNLTPEKWTELWQIWRNRHPSTSPPFMWCGKPTGLGSRILFRAYLEGENRFGIGYLGSLPEDDVQQTVAWLNECLAEMGESPVAADVPSGIDWHGSYCTTSNEQTEVSHPPAKQDG
jgi:hypothetical protein